MYEKLLAQRQAAQDQLAALLETVANATDPTDEQMGQVKALEAKIAKLDTLVTAAEADRQRRLDAEAVTVHVAEVNDGIASVNEARNASARGTASISVGKPNIMKDPKRGFRDMGEFASSVQRAMDPASRATDDRLATLAAATGMNQASGADGGFMVPPEFSTSIYAGLMDASDSLLGMCDTYTVTGESLTLLANAETSRANGSRWGGVRGYWISEAAQITSSFPKLRQIKLEPKQLAVLVYATDKLLRNAPALSQYINRAAVDELNFMIGDSLIEGTGAGQPLGVLNASCTVSVAKESSGGGQAAATIVSANINKMWSRWHAQSRRRGVWFINQDIEPQLEMLSVDVGTGGVPVYLPPGGIADAPNARLKGRPVLPLEYCATLGTVGDIIAADMSAMAVGLQGTVDTAMSMHLRFDYAETAFRFMFALDAQPWLAAAMTPFKGTNTLSPFVTLATRA